MPMDMERQLSSAVDTIPQGQSTSNGVKIAGSAQGTIFFPLQFTGTSLTVEASYDGTHYGRLFQSDGTTVVNFGVEANGFAVALPTECFGQPWIRFVSSNVEAAARTLIITLAG